MHCTSPLGWVLGRMLRCFHYSEEKNLIYSVWTFSNSSLHLRDQIFDLVTFCLNQKWTSIHCSQNHLFKTVHQFWCTVLVHREMSWSTAMKWTGVNHVLVTSLYWNASRHWCTARARWMSVVQNVEMLSIQWVNKFDLLSVNVFKFFLTFAWAIFFSQRDFIFAVITKWTNILWSQFRFDIIHQYWCTVLMHREMSWSTAMKWRRVNQFKWELLN